jgi:integrase
MKHIEKRANLYYAVLTVPQDVRHIIGRGRYLQSTQTADKGEALLRASLLVARWKADIAKARGTLPDPKASFWETLRADFINAKDEDHQLAVQDQIETAVRKVRDDDQSSNLWKFATGQATPLAPLVWDWKASLRLVQKTIDQQHRDVTRMAEHFINLEALEPKWVKAWTDQLITEGLSATSLERIMNGCRSLWRYLQDSGTVPVDAVDPFAGSFRLATKRATRKTVTRQSFTPDDLAKVYAQAQSNGDSSLADLIALGAYTGARIEELCSITLDTSQDGAFNIQDSKTEAGIRQVPIHPRLVPLVKRLQESSRDGYLIPSTAAGKYGVRSDPLSKRFGRLKESMGFGPGHVFHSIRKTVATLLEQAGVPEGIAADILGHEKPTLTFGLYSSGSAMKDKLKAIGKPSWRRGTRSRRRCWKRRTERSAVPHSRWLAASLRLPRGRCPSLR